MAQQLRQRRARRGAPRLERERAAVGLDRAVDVLERTRAQAPELLEHVRQAGRIVSGVTLGELRERSASGAPLALGAQQPRRRDGRLDAAGVGRRGDAEGLGRQARFAEALERPPAHGGESRAFGRVRDALERAGGDAERLVDTPRLPGQIREQEPCARASRIGLQRGAQVLLGRGVAPARAQLDFGRAQQTGGAGAGVGDLLRPAREGRERLVDAPSAFVQQGDPFRGLRRFRGRARAPPGSA